VEYKRPGHPPALVEIAKHPGGREFLTKLDKLTAKIPLSTGSVGQGEKYGKIEGTVTVVTNNGKTVDAKGGPLEVTVDFKLAATDRETNKALTGMGEKPVENVPGSDAEQLGHELSHGENEIFGLPDSEKGATGRIDDILAEPTDMNSKDAAKFVDQLLKPNSNSQQQPPPPPPCTAEKDKPCPK
jgi:hypothetical protein